MPAALQDFHGNTSLAFDGLCEIWRLNSPCQSQLFPKNFTVLFDSTEIGRAVGEVILLQSRTPTRIRRLHSHSTGKVAGYALLPTNKSNLWAQTTPQFVLLL